MRKGDRQKLIEALIKQKALATQSQLVKALEKAGILATQATISRDIREMGVQKRIGSDGRLRFMLPPARTAGDPESVLARVLQDSGAAISRAQNLIVVKSQPGTAPAVGRAIDELADELVIGTVAGDDTVLMVIADGAAAKQVVERFIKLMQA